MAAKVQAAGILRTSRDSTWKTPEWLLERVRVFFNGPIPFDPATANDNPTKAVRFCAGPTGTLFARESLESKNGLEVAWEWPFWVNPPFAREWIEKIGREGAHQTGVALLPCNRFEEPYLQKTIATARVLCLVDAERFNETKRKTHRIAFISSVDGQPCDANPFGSMLLGFGEVARFAEAFARIGRCFELREIGATA
jgi:hypothetical protein